MGMAFCAFASGADTLPAGDFEDLDGPGGYLVIQPAVGERRAFELVAYGANRHTCGLSGNIEGHLGEASATGSSSICRVDFHPLPNAMRVETADGAGNFEACRTFCGMRASFDRTYYKPPPGCTRPERQALVEAFRQAEGAKEYGRALGVLQRVQADCGRFLGWIERDAVHNHVALTLHRLDKNADCLIELDKTRASSAGGESALREQFPGEPMSLEAYLPTARTTWHVRSICSGAEPKAP